MTASGLLIKTKSEVIYMKLLIRTRSNQYLEIENFEKVVYYTQSWQEKSPEQLDKIRIISQVTYNFIGSTKISLNGADIEYIQTI